MMKTKSKVSNECPECEGLIMFIPEKGEDVCSQCGLIINEIISNSLKHAFPDGRKGKICIVLRSEKDGKFKLNISDNGVGLPKDLDIHNTESLGMQLITMLVDQLQGTLTLDRNQGTSFKIIFKELKYSKDG